MGSKIRLIYIAGGLAGVALGAWLLRAVPNGRTIVREAESPIPVDADRPDPLRSARISEHAEV